MQQQDIIVFGATSFVGKLVAEYMLARYPAGSDVNWAIAGRSESKLAALKQALGEGAAHLPTLVVDASDHEGIGKMCDAAKLIISTVGPYALYGEALVKACASSGTDYCDLTGEPQWIQRMLKRYEAVAKISGARIIHCCGFDSIPSDLGVYFLQQQSLDKLGRYCDTVKMRVQAMKGGASGGTIASMLNLVKEVSKDPSLRKLLANPYALCPEGHGFKARQINIKSGCYDPDIQAWIAPFVMAAINTRIVHRTNALLDIPYSSEFKYDEAVVTGKSAKGSVKATAMSIGLGGFMMASAIPPTRWLLESFVLPKPGEGPDKKARETGFYSLDFVGTTSAGQKLTCRVTGDRDPGYGSTAKMLSESALCLLKELPNDVLPGGFWTPASGMGDALITRLETHAGLTFSLLNG